MTQEVVHLDEVRARKVSDACGRSRAFRHDDTTAEQDAGAHQRRLSIIDAAIDGITHESLSSRMKQPRERIFGFAVAGSLALHAVMIAWLIWREPISSLGAGGQELEAVSIEIINASALESMTSHASPTSGGAATSTDHSPGPQLSEEQIEVVAMTKPAAQLPEAAPEAMLKPDPSPLPADIAAAEIVKPEPKPIEADRQREVQDARHVPGPDTVQVAAQPAIVAGGGSSRAATETVATDGSAGASAGQLTRYAIDVRLAIGRTKPRHDGGRGRVQVAFGLTETGSVRFAEVARSSGLSQLDEAAVHAIHRTTFPAPPPGMTDMERTYVVPFEFK